MFHDIDKKIKPGPSVELDCSVCDESAANASTEEVVETVRVLGFIKLFSHRNTYIQCGACQSRFLTPLRLDELESMVDLGPYLKQDISFVAKFLAIVSIPLFWFPILGLLIPLIAYLIARKSPNWVSKVSFFTLVFSIIAHLLWGVMAVTQAFQ